MNYLSGAHMLFWVAVILLRLRRLMVLIASKTELSDRLLVKRTHDLAIRLSKWQVKRDFCNQDQWSVGLLAKIDDN